MFTRINLKGNEGEDSENIILIASSLNKEI